MYLLFSDVVVAIEWIKCIQMKTHSFFFMHFLISPFLFEREREREKYTHRQMQMQVLTIKPYWHRKWKTENNMFEWRWKWVNKLQIPTSKRFGLPKKCNCQNICFESMSTNWGRVITWKTCKMYFRSCETKINIWSWGFLCLFIYKHIYLFLLMMVVRLFIYFWSSVFFLSRFYN